MKCWFLILYSKNRLLSHVSDIDLKEVLSKVVDKAFKSIKLQSKELTLFLDPYQQEQAIAILRGMKELKFKLFGGYEYSERRRLVIVSCNKDIIEEDFNLKYLQIKGNFNFSSINHRDVLGALMSLGLKREILGDILISDDAIQIVVDSLMVNYIKSNLNKIKKASISSKIVTKDMLVLPKKEFKKIRITISSVRLDAVISKVFNMSRKKACKVIKSENVKLNWKITTKVTDEIKQGDTISLRGKGRIQIFEIEGETKKGRIAIIIGKYS